MTTGCVRCGKRITARNLYCQSCRVVPAVLDGRNSLPPAPLVGDRWCAECGCTTNHTTAQHVAAEAAGRQEP